MYPWGLFPHFGLFHACHVPFLHKTWKSQMIPVFLLQNQARLWSRFLFGMCKPLFKNWLAFTGKGIYLSAKLPKTWWWCLAKWFSVEICKGIWEFQLLANLPWAWSFMPLSSTKSHLCAPSSPSPGEPFSFLYQNYSLTIIPTCRLNTVTNVRLSWIQI